MKVRDLIRLFEGFDPDIDVNIRRRFVPEGDDRTHITFHKIVGVSVVEDTDHPTVLITAGK